MSDFDVQTSKTGFDTTTTGLKNQVFDASLNQLKVFEIVTGSFSITSIGSTFTFTIPHNQGVIPAYYPMIRSSGNRWWGAHGWDPVSGVVFWTTIDKDNIILKAHLVAGFASPPLNIQLKAYILVDQGTDTAGNTATSDQTELKVSIPGQDVTTTNDQGLNLATVFNTLQKIEVVTLIVQGITGFSTFETTLHGLGYTPAWFALATDNGSGVTTVVPFVRLLVKEISVYTTATNVVAVFGTTNGTPENITFKIALLNNKLE